MPTRPQSVAELIAAGNRAEGAGRTADACALYRQAIEADPRHASARLNLGAALEAGGDLDGAESAYRAVLSFDPGNAFAHYNLASVAQARGDAAGAEALLRMALRAKPDFPEAHVALSNALDSAGNLEEAAEHLASAIRLRPDYAGAWHNHARLLVRLERIDEAEDALRRTVELAPDDAGARRALGGLLRGEGRIAEALEVYAEARRRFPKALDVEAAELFTLLFSDAIADDELLARHRDFGARLDAMQLPAQPKHNNTPDPGRPLRIGYVSADFYRHPVALFLIPVLEHRDRSAFHVRCYSTGTQSDDVTNQLRRLADGWRDAAALDDAALAAAIRADEIDILVDLTGYAGELRLGVFARRPAPVQASWLGYLHSLGSRAIDYRICDPHTDPPGQTEHAHTEALERLPASQWCYRPFLAVDAARLAPCSSKGHVTFGSFNHRAKLSPTTRAQWREILRRVPDSRLIVVGIRSERTSQALLQDLTRDGVDPLRITLVERVLLDAYFRWFNQVDIALDTQPYSAATTTCDALWMGVPVVTAPGTRSISRSSASLLASAGLADWIARSPEHYSDLAVQKAGDRAALAALRGGLRETMRRSPLMDEVAFTRSLQNAYRAMWRRWCK